MEDSNMFIYLDLLFWAKKYDEKYHKSSIKPPSLISPSFSEEES